MVIIYNNNESENDKWINWIFKQGKFKLFNLKDKNRHNSTMVSITIYPYSTCRDEN